LVVFQRNQDEKFSLESKRTQINLEKRSIEDQIRNDPSSKLRDQIGRLKKELEKNERDLAEIQPIVDELAEKLGVIEDRQKNEVAYRATERKKAEDGLNDAEATLKRLEASSANAIQQLELDKLAVSILEKQIVDDEADLRTNDETRSHVIGERDAIKLVVDDLKVNFNTYKGSRRLIIILF
jgi:chromosome segregation ATPase